MIGYNDSAPHDDWDDYVVGLNALPIPEPSSYLLLLAGFMICFSLQIQYNLTAPANRKSWLYILNAVQAGGTERENAVARLNALQAKHALDERGDFAERGVVLDFGKCRSRH